MSSQAGLLFTLNGEKGKFKKLSNGVFRATIDDVNDHVVWFTGSPHREAGDMSIQEFIGVWDDAFKEIRPNVAQVIRGENGQRDTVVYEMFKPAYNENKDRIKFRLKLNDEQKPIVSGDGPAESNINSTKESIPEEDRELLFSLRGEQGKFTKMRKGVFKAEINQVSDDLIWFTDRPYREAGGVNINDLIDGWDDAFGKTRPNAAQVITQKNGKKDTLVYEMYKPSYNKKTDILQFKLKLHDDQALDALSGNMEKFAYNSDHKFKNKFGDTSLFLDNWKLDDSDIRSVNSFNKDIELFTVDAEKVGKDDEFVMKFDDTNLYIDSLFAKDTAVAFTNNFDRDIILHPIDFAKDGKTTSDWVKTIVEGTLSGVGAAVSEFAVINFLSKGALVDGGALNALGNAAGLAAEAAAKAAGLGRKAALNIGLASGFGAIALAGVAVVDAIETEYSTIVDESRDPIIIPSGETYTVSRSDSRWGFSNGVQDVGFLVSTELVKDPLTGVSDTGTEASSWVTDVIGSVFFDNPTIGSTNAKLYPWDGVNDPVPHNLSDENGLVLDENETARKDFIGGYMETTYRGNQEIGDETVKLWELQFNQT